MDDYSKEKDKILKLFEEVDSGDESVYDPFSDDGEYGSDPNYEPDGEDSDEVPGENEKLTSTPPASPAPMSLELNNNEVLSDSISENDEDIANSSDSEQYDEPYPEMKSEEEWFENTTEIPQFNFVSENCGVKINVDENCTPRKIFDEIFTSDIITKLVSSTNMYGTNLCTNSRPQTRNARFATFKLTCNEEMFKFLGVCLLQGQIKAPKIIDMFSNDPLYYHPVFRNTMTGRRFEQVLRCLSCSPKKDDETKLKKLSHYLIFL